MRYTLRQLEIFLATIHHESLSRAANSLAMSQSAASGALKELENQFDVVLFDRVGKRLQLNDVGRALQPKAEEVLERARELESVLGHHRQAGPLRIGATLSIGNYLAVPLLTTYMEQNPGSKVSLEVANTATISNKIARFELDIGLIEGEIHNPELDIERWQQDELVVFCAPKHTLAQQRFNDVSLTDKELQAAQWILRETGSGTRQTFDRAMHDLLPNLSVLLELQHTEAIKRAVESGIGVGCLSRVTVRDAFERGSLVELPLLHRDLRRYFYIILHKQKYLSAAIERWLELIKKQ